MVHYVPSEFGAWLLAMSSSANRSPVIDPLSTNEDCEQWFLTNGGYLHPHIELSSDSITGQCLRVKPESDISADTTIVSCPHKLALSWPSARKFHYPEVQLPPCSQHVATRFFLMKQRLLGPASPWWPYIKMLPQFFNTPLYYDSKDMAWIRGTNLGNGKKVREDDWHNEYDEAVRTLFPTGIDNKQKNLWTWSVSTCSPAGRWWRC